MNADHSPGLGNKLMREYQENKAKFIGVLDKAKQAESGQENMAKLSNKLVHHLVEQRGIATVSESEKDLIKQQAEIASLKLLDIIKRSVTEDDIIYEVSKEIEHIASIESVLVVKQTNNLFVIQQGKKKQFWPNTDDSIYSSIIGQQRQLIINDVSKEIEIVEEIRRSTNIKKLYNLMFIPVCPTLRTQEGALILLVNRFSSDDNVDATENRRYINFNTY